VKLLLDTQAWLWMQASPEKLSPEALDLVGDSRTELFLSAVSSWEISIKYALGSLPLPAPPFEYVPSRMKSSGVQALPITHAHALQVGELPQHHRDPFDRLLIAQAQIEGLPILTSDRQFAAYKVKIRWAAP